MIHDDYLVTARPPDPGCGLGSVFLVTLAVGLTALLIYVGVVGR